MNADQWLHVATADMPAHVAQRIEQDTREHLLDAGAESGVEVDLLLGSPEEMAQQLKKLYLTREELDLLDSKRQRIFFRGVLLIAVISVLLSLEQIRLGVSIWEHQLRAQALGGDLKVNSTERLVEIAENCVTVITFSVLVVHAFFLKGLMRQQWAEIIVGCIMASQFVHVFEYRSFESLLGVFSSISYLVTYGGVSFAVVVPYYQRRQKLRRTLRLMA